MVSSVARSQRAHDNGGDPMGCAVVESRSADGRPVSVDVSVAQGLPQFLVVGEGAPRETRDRVRYLDGMGIDGRNAVDGHDAAIHRRPWEQEAWEALDRALDEVDGAVRTFESDDPRCRHCGAEVEPDDDDPELWQHIEDGGARCHGSGSWTDVEAD